MEKATGKSTRKKKEPQIHRLTTHAGANSSSMEVAPTRVPIGEAMRQAVEALGDVTIQDELAPQQLRELADCYEEIMRRQTAFNARSEDAKTAKKSLESAQELLLTKVRQFTHAASLPLFDASQAEKDRTTMLESAAQTAPEGVPGDSVPF